MKFSLRNISENLVRDGFRPQIYCHYREDIFFFIERDFDVPIPVSTRLETVLNKQGTQHTIKSDLLKPIS